MRYFTLVLLSFFSTLCFSQNWSLMNSGYEYHYAINGEYHTTVKADSFELIGADTLFFLNRIVSPCDSCINAGSNEYLRYNMPTFLQRQVLKQDTAFTFSDTANFILKPKASLNDTWVFDATNNISAEIISIDEQVVLGATDSVKTVLLSTLDTIKISKTFGVIQFLGFKLIGLENNNICFGFKLPNHLDFYNFNVGDVFQYEQNNFNGSVTPYPLLEIFKRTILSKQITPEGYTYIMNEKRITSYLHNPISYTDTNSTFFTDKNIEVSYTKDNTILAQTYNNQLISADQSPTLFFNFNIISFVKKDSNGVVTKNFGGENQNLEFSAFVFHSNELLAELDNVSFHRQQIKIELGEIFLESGEFEGHTKRKLTGYIKNGVQTGEVWEDWKFTGINELEKVDNLFNIYPNPTKNSLKVSLESNFTKIHIEITNLLGEILLESSLKNESSINLDLTKLSTGVYFIQVETDKKYSIQKFVKH